MMSKFTRRHVLAATAATIAAPTVVRADTWPSRTVRVLVPYSAGGGADTVSRILFAKLSQKLGQEFIIDNRGGAGGTLGASAVSRAERDGYTILYDATAFSVNPSLYKKLPYDSAKDFEPVFLASLVTNFLLVHPSIKAKTVNDVIAIAKAAPNGLNWASSGNGTVQHLCLELFRFMAHVKLNHIPYRGGGPALNDMIAGQVKFFFSNGASSIGMVQSGTLHAIAHTGHGRLKNLPDLPTMEETLPGFVAYEWNGVFVPSGVAPEIVQKLNAGLNAVLLEPDIVARLDQLNVESRQNTPADFRKFVAEETAKWGKVVHEANIHIG
jgi:tripartite-type tricarboxylate transporter receptor subunit TctC